MAGMSSVHDDGGFLSRLDRRLVVLERFFALLSGLAAFSLMILAVWSVGGRKFFGAPLAGYVDYIELLMPLIAILGISYVQREGGHIRMDILIGRLRGRALWAAEFLSVLLMLVLMALLVWGSWAHFARSFDWSLPLWSRDSTIDIGLPIWPSKLVVPVAFSILCLRLMLQAWSYGRALVTGAPRPVAVPLIEDAATQALHEAEHVSGVDD